MDDGYRTRVLIVDRPDNRIGALALRLTRLGLDPLYSSDRDEAVLLAAQEGRRVGAVAVAADLDAAELDFAIKNVAARAGLRGDALVPIGARPPDSAIVALRERGVRWALWEPIDDASMRFVLCAVLSRQGGTDLRLEPRVPAPGLAARIYKGSIGRDAAVVDLSVGGAFLAGDKPLPEGSRVSLEIDLDGGATLRLRALVRWARREDASGRDDLCFGMGVEFEDAGPEVAGRLRRFVQAQMASFVVTAAQPAARSDAPPDAAPDAAPDAELDSPPDA